MPFDVGSFHDLLTMETLANDHTINSSVLLGSDDSAHEERGGVMRQSKYFIDTVLAGRKKLSTNRALPVGKEGNRRVRRQPIEAIIADMSLRHQYLQQL